MKNLSFIRSSRNAAIFSIFNLCSSDSSAGLPNFAQNFSFFPKYSCILSDFSGISTPKRSRIVLAFSQLYPKRPRAFTNAHLPKPIIFGLLEILPSFDTFEVLDIFEPLGSFEASASFVSFDLSKTPIGAFSASIIFRAFCLSQSF